MRNIISALGVFDFFKKKIDTQNIRNFQDVIKITNFYISEKKWDKARTILKESNINERKNSDIQINKLDKNDSKIFDEQKTKILKNLNNNLEKLKKLEIKLSQNESKFKFVPESIKRYEDAIRSIKTLILLKDWKKAKEAIKEVKKAEKKGLDNLLNTLEKNGDELIIENERRKQLKIFEKKEKQLEKIYYKVINSEDKYNKKISEEKFKIRFKKIKGEIELLSKTGKNTQALNLLKHFLEENNSNSIVIKFYNKEKSKILKNIEMNRKRDEERIKKNIKLEAQRLAGQTIKIDDNYDDKKEIKSTFFKILKNKLNIYYTIKEKIRQKKLIDEVSLLIEENNNINREIATKKLETIHKGLTKEIKGYSMYGYDLYGKILGADKISGDTFGLDDSKNKYSFYLGDATGHGIKAGLIITLLTRLFNKFVNKKSLQELAFEINNGLKQDLQSRNFITGILFEINKDNINKVNYVGMGHEPMLIYRKKTHEIEKVIPGGLAAGIRIIKDKSHIKVKNINIENGDIILIFSDGTVESKSPDNIFFGLDRLKDSFKKACQTEKTSTAIYSKLINDLIQFRGGSAFDDDNTLMILKRDESSDIQKENSSFLKKVIKEEKIEKKYKKNLTGKNKTQIQNEIKKIKKEKELNLIIISLKKLFQVGEFLKLKQESIRYIKDGWVHKDINFYLKKALENETKYKIGLKNKKINNKYNVIHQLYKKGDYDTVIKELESIIAKDGDI